MLRTIAISIVWTLLCTSWANGQVAEADPSDAPPAAEPNFYEQLHRYYERAKDSGTTTANSAAHWFADQYERTSKSASETTGDASNWISELYQKAANAGETNAKSVKDWVVEDISKIGTWQYKVIKIGKTPNFVEGVLNRLGAQRWEAFAVGAGPQPTSTLVYLRRPHRSYLRQLPAKDLVRLLPLLHGSPTEN